MMVKIAPCIPPAKASGDQAPSSLGGAAMQALLQGDIITEQTSPKQQRLFAQDQ